MKLWHRLGPEPGYVYVMTDRRAIKVGGTSRTPEKRLKDLQTGNPTRIEVLTQWSTRDWPRLEAALHDVLDRHRGEVGEWFFCSFDDVKEAHEIVMGGGPRLWLSRRYAGAWRAWHHITHAIWALCTFTGALGLLAGIGWLSWTYQPWNHV